MSRLLCALVTRETWRCLSAGVAFALVWSATFQSTGAAAAGRQDRPAAASTLLDPAARAALDEATQLHAEAEKLAAQRQFTEATQKAERALALRRQHLLERHPDVASSLAQLGSLAYSQGNYPRAETLVGQALEIRESTLGPNDPAVAQSLSDLASMLTVRGDYVRPEPLFERALAIYEKTSDGPGAAEAQTLAASALNNLGFLYHRRGDYARSEAAYLKALAIRERLRGPDDVTVADAAANIGGMYYDSGQYDKAVEALKRAIAIQEKRLPANHPSLATSSSNLAAVYYDQGDYANAEALFERALRIDEQVDPKHPRMAVRLTGLAETLRLKGDYARAAPLYERAAAIREQALGAAHPSVTDTFISRSLLQYAMGQFDAAVSLLSRAAALREDTLALVLTSGSEDNKRLYLATLAEETDIAVSLHLGSARGSASAATLALTNVVQRKGRSMDAMAGHMATLRRRLNDEDRATLNQFSEAQSRLATLVLRGISTGEQTKAAAALRADVERLEQTISARSTEFSVTSKTPAVADIQRVLPPGTALIELAAYRPFSVKTRRRDAFGAPHYAAYVLRDDGSIGSADLGEAAVIDRLVQRFRAGLSNPNNDGVRTAARALHQAVLQPLESSLRGIDRLLISPDGALNLIPFAALVDAQDRYLVERYTISYLTSGRDLARLRESSPARAGGRPAIIANPSFDGLQVIPATAPVPATTAAARAVDARMLDSSLRFTPLPGTAEEAVALASVLPEARVYTGADATEAALKQLNAPSILHIATHGFFLQPSSGDPGSTRGLTAAGQTVNAVANRQDALVLSGIALAGANQRWSGGGEDGILTALEATGLDLWGTRMVVLSACETGVGDARNGEGVYGLRRALVLAGAESQVMSLWQVSDAATRDLMIAYYQRLRAHEGRADGLRNVQLATLRDRTRAHPFYWASFIQSGDWRELFDSKP